MRMWLSNVMCVVVFVLVFLPCTSNVFAEENQQAPEYVAQNTGVIHQFVDGYTGRIISQEQFIAQSRQIESGFMSGANQLLGEAHQYMTSASEGEDRKTTQGVIDGIEQAKRDVAKVHADTIRTAENYKPRQIYEKPRVLVSG